MGGVATGVIGVVMMPWKLMADPRGYIFQWLLGYSGGLGSIAGVLVCDYWFVRKRRLELADLYRPHGSYPNVRWAGIVATGVGCLLAWIGLVVPPLRPMFDYAWFVGALGSAGTYFVWSKLS
jgi:NCS1 family nucleobase:cation symporter-1